jgi:hypothetical protein
MLGGIEVSDFPGALGVVARGVKAGDKANARFFAQERFPKAFAAVTGAGERPNTSDDDA